MTAIITDIHSPEYASIANKVMNEDVAWNNALMDSPDGKRIVNADGTLRHEDHRRIMEKLVTVRRLNLNGIKDLFAAGLTSSESIGTTLVGRESIDEFRAAKTSMNPVAGDNNQIDFLLKYVPLPINHSGWRIPFRQIGFPYKQSTGMTESVRQVNEATENMLFNGNSDIVVDINGVKAEIKGYTTTSFRQTLAISDWTDLATNREKIVDETLEMVSLAFREASVSDANSMILYVGKAIWTNMQADYTLQKGDKTLKQRIEDIAEIKEVKYADKLRDIEVLLVEMSDATIELAVAARTTTVPVRRTSDVDDQAFFTYNSMVPIIKEDRNGKTGIVHGTRP